MRRFVDNTVVFEGCALVQVHLQLHTEKETSDNAERWIMGINETLGNGADRHRERQGERRKAGTVYVGGRGCSIPRETQASTNCWRKESHFCWMANTEDRIVRKS